MTEYEAVQLRVKAAVVEMMEALIAAQNLGSYTRLLVSQHGDKTTLEYLHEDYRTTLLGETTTITGRLTRGNPKA